MTFVILQLRILNDSVKYHSCELLLLLVSYIYVVSQNNMLYVTLLFSIFASLGYSVKKRNVKQYL